MTVTPEQLTEVYHVVYDVKDSEPQGSRKAYTAYETLKALATLLDQQGVPVPRRRDGDGRPLADGWFVWSKDGALVSGPWEDERAAELEADDNDGAWVGQVTDGIRDDSYWVEEAK